MKSCQCGCCGTFQNQPVQRHSLTTPAEGCRISYNPLLGFARGLPRADQKGRILSCTSLHLKSIIQNPYTKSYFNIFMKCVINCLAFSSIVKGSLCKLKIRFFYCSCGASAWCFFCFLGQKITSWLLLWVKMLHKWCQNMQLYPENCDKINTLENRNKYMACKREGYFYCFFVCSLNSMN